MRGQNIAGEQENVFHQVANTFEITVTLTDQRKLVVFLKDFIDSCSYQQEYTKNSIDNKNRPIDLVNIYQVLKASQTGSTQIKDEGLKLIKGEVIQNYKFGQIIKANKMKCYKIDRGGVVTIYETFSSKVTGQEVVLQLKLQLSKMRKLTQLEVFSSKLELEKREMIEKFNKIMLKNQQKRQNLLKMVINMQQERKLDKFRQYILFGILLLFCFMLGYWLNLNGHLAQKNAELTGRIQEIQASLFRTEMKYSTIISRLYFLNSSTNGINQPQPLTLNFSPEPNSQKFRIAPPKLTYASPTKTFSQYIFNSPLPPNKTSSFKFHITSSLNNFIIIGVVDYNLHKNKQSSYSYGLGSGQGQGLGSGFEDVLCYVGWNGDKCGLGQEGQGFRMGDVVEVLVDRRNGSVEFWVNGGLVARSQSGVLGDGARVFVPYVEMYDAGDTIQLI